VQEAWPRWATSGVSHHSAATNRHLAADVRVVARHLGIEYVSV
jgi:L-arabinose isomerase